MAIFDSTKKHYLNFFIHLTDADAVKQYQAAHPNGVNRAPWNRRANTGAAIEFGAPWKGYTEPAASEAPFSWTPFSGEEEEDGPYPLHLATFERRSGGFLGIGGTTLRYYWMGQFVLAADANVPPGEPAPAQEANIPKRRWACGFEAPGIDSPVPSAGMGYSRDASRHAGGFGLAIRGAVNATIQKTLDDHGTAANNTRSWERFYIRLRRKPDVSAYFWRWYGSPSAAVGHLLAITAAGELALYYSTAGSVISLIQTIPGVTLEEWDGDPKNDVWRKIDILLDTGDTAPPIAAHIRIYVDGELKLDREVDGGQDRHTGSRLGTQQTDQNNLFLDVDDWINAEIPGRTIDGNDEERLNGKDWMNGTKIALLRATGFGPGHGAWVGDFRLANQNNGGTSSFANTSFTSSSSGDVLEVTTDSDIVADGDKGSIGVASVGVHSIGQRGVTNADHALGVKLAGGAAQDVAVNFATSVTARSVFFTNETTEGESDSRPTLADVTPIILRHVKAANAEAAQAHNLLGTVELIGKWGRPDFAPAEREGMETFPASGGVGTHNGIYPRSPWSVLGIAPPISPYIVTMGTYTGNGTGQDLTFKAPVTMFYVRPLTSGQGGYLWAPPMQSSRRGFSIGAAAQIDALEDTTFVGSAGEDAQQQQYIVRVAGANTQINANGVTYQYLAIQDPGMRFSLFGTMSTKGSTAVERTWPTVHPTFDAEFLMLMLGAFSSTSTSAFFARDENEGTAAVNGFGGSGISDAVTLAPGSITAKTNLAGFSAGNAAQDQTYMLFRRSDGNQNPDEATAMFFGSYTGDGAASRTVNLAPAAGRRPAYVFVFPNNANVGYMRDPSHTSNNSTNANGTDGTTGITSGGVDQFSVGSALNANGVTYSYWGVYGIADCVGNNGWGCNGEHGLEPEAPASGAEGPYPPTPPEPVDPGTEEPTPGGPGFPGGPPTGGSSDFDLSVECAPWSTYLTNIALSRIGISRQIGSLTTDVSEEAFKARLVYAQEVDATLRDFPWPFATRYANLVLVAGTADVPVNKDWTYSYRAPADMVFARRLVSQDGRKRAWDPDPPKFRVGTDATGYLIYTDLAATSTVPVHLEYTVRMTCPAQQGDALFRDALIWRLASALALSIARDNRKAADCLAMYQGVLAAAKDVASDEQQQEKTPGDADWITGR